MSTPKTTSITITLEIPSRSWAARGLLLLNAFIPRATNEELILSLLNAEGKNLIDDCAGDDLEGQACRIKGLVADLRTENLGADDEE